MNLFEELKTILARLDLEKVDYALCGGYKNGVGSRPVVGNFRKGLDPVEVDEKKWPG